LEKVRTKCRELVARYMEGENLCTFFPCLNFSYRSMYIDNDDGSDDDDDDDDDKLGTILSV
jgi:hypothetical protein